MTDIQARKEGNLIVVDLPQVPTGSCGISKQREWVGLTDEETNALIQKWAGELVFEVTQALKEKNNG